VINVARERGIKSSRAQCGVDRKKSVTNVMIKKIKDLSMRFGNSFCVSKKRMKDY
jgi:hypothetical protein